MKISWHLLRAFSSISGFEAHCPRFNDITGSKHVSLTFQLVAKRSARTACLPFVSVKSSLAFPLNVPHRPLVLSNWSGPTVTDIIFIPILTFIPKAESNSIHSPMCLIVTPWNNINISPEVYRKYEQKIVHLNINHGYFQITSGWSLTLVCKRLPWS